MTSPSSRASSDIAVIGMAGRFPGAASVEEFWDNLRHGHESVFPILFEDEPTHSLPTWKAVGGRLDGVELFDAAFFGYSRAEAEITDPQHRLFLECAWEALENAAYVPERVPESIGVFAGASPGWYGHRLYAIPDLVKSVGTMQLMIGNEDHFLATKVSYKLDLRGPSLVIQTACSTSLVAIHYACQSILNGECDMALAGGVGLTFSADPVDSTGQEAIISGDGHCRAFDADAQGTLPGEGVGIVVLKRLSDALRDGDHIHAVVKGSAVNNDGAAKASFAAPSVDGQARVVTEALAVSGVSAQTISYVEAHGTATLLGDPIEVAALTEAFRRDTQEQGFCALGSVKTNIGHLDAAAGVAGFIKCVLALENKFLPPSLHFNKPNPQIDFEHSPFFVVRRPSPWEKTSGPRRASVNACGFGGTNAHVVLEEAGDQTETRDSKRSEGTLLWILSAKTPSALEKATDNLLTFLKRNQVVDLADAAYTLQAGRKAFSHRRILVATGREELLEALAERRTVDFVCRTSVPVGSPANKHSVLIEEILEKLAAAHSGQLETIGAGSETCRSLSLDLASLWKTIGERWLSGFDIDWDVAYNRRGRRIPLPTYPFERQKYWINPHQASSTSQQQWDRDRAQAPVRRDDIKCDDIETAVNTIWSEVFGVTEVVPNDNFFDSGGDSLTATQFISRLRRTFKIELSLRGFFDNPTPKGVFSMIETKLRASASESPAPSPRIGRAASRIRV